MPSDPRAAQAREHHRRSLEAARLADQERDARDRLVRQLRAEDPERWTWPALGAAVGISKELAAAICKGRTGKRT